MGPMGPGGPQQAALADALSQGGAPTAGAGAPPPGGGAPGAPPPTPMGGMDPGMAVQLAQEKYNITPDNIQEAKAVIETLEAAMAGAGGGAPPMGPPGVA